MPVVEGLHVLKYIKNTISWRNYIEKPIVIISGSEFYKDPTMQVDSQQPGAKCAYNVI